MSVDLTCNLIASLYIFGVVVAFIVLWAKAERRAAKLASSLAAEEVRANSWRDSHLGLLRKNEVLQKLLYDATEKLKPKPISAPISPEWLSSDILTLRKFLTEETGQKLMRRGRAMEYLIATTGAKDRFHPAHSNGMTEAWGDSLNWVESHASDEMFSRVVGERTTNQQYESGAQDDAELLETRSP